MTAERVRKWPGQLLAHARGLGLQMLNMTHRISSALARPPCQWLARGAGLWAVLLLLAVRPFGVQAADMAMFTSQVEPLLRQHCFKCHSHSADKIKGGLVLDSVEAMLVGGDIGPAIVPGQPEKSRLIEAVKQTGDLKMPPKGTKLSTSEVALLENWIKQGAPAPKTAANLPNAPARRTGRITDEDRQWWAYQPVKDPFLPAIKGSAWGRNEIDRFILARLQQ
jgi:mono/diheme cytochrome c family protein